MAKLRTLPQGDSLPFIQHVKHIFLADVDRIYAEVDKGFLDRLDALAKDPKQPFYFEGHPASPDHQRLLKRATAFDNMTGYTLESYRQEGKNSMQAVIAIPPDDRPDGRYFADIDIDLGNPLQDVEGFVIHMGELFSGKQTDHFKLHDELAKGPTGKFLYYDVKKN